jgi:hypothetical protein
MDGFILKNSAECKLNPDKINFDKFQKVEKYIPYEESCNITETRQLFSFVFSYIINKGENFAIQSEEYNDIIFGKNQNDEKFGLNCIIDINPKYFPSEQYSGTCKEKTCTLMFFVNCSFHEKVPNGIYDIQSNSNTELGNLINKAKDEINPIQIKYSETKISTKILEDSIQVVYEGYIGYSQIIYICQNINMEMYNCDYLKSCKRESYDVVSARAVARLSMLSELCLPLVKVGGVFLAMKSKDYEEELKEANQAIKTLGGEILDVKHFNLPYDLGERV